MPIEMNDLRVSLQDLGRNLTALASADKLSPNYERHEIVSQVAGLISTNENSVLLVGESGVGKNGIVEALARRISAGSESTKTIGYDAIIEASAAAFQLSCFYVHNFETKVDAVIGQLNNKKAILFLDDIQSSITAGTASGAEDRTLANLLLPYLTRNAITIVGATTPEGYRFMKQRNSAFASRFIVVDVPAMTPTETLELLEILKDGFFSRYYVVFPGDTFQVTVDMAARFYPEKSFPGKAFDLLKEAIALRPNAVKPPGLSKVTPEGVWEVIRRRTGLPSSMIQRSEVLKRKEITAFFAQRLYGQKDGVREIVNTILSIKAELNAPQKPAGVFLFAGPTGVGKTFLARLSAEYLFGTESRLFRYDMAEYATYDSIERLIGGRQTGRRGILIEDVSAYPFSVLLFDEIEKAHPNIFNLLLSVLGEGRLTDFAGRTVYFYNTIIIMTSNIGSDIFSKMPIGIQSEEAVVNEAALAKRVKDYFSPEFINRITKIILFNTLGRDEIRQIAENEIRKLMERRGIIERKLRIGISDRLIDFITEKGFSSQYGARPMQRAVQTYIGVPLAEAIASGEICNGEILSLDIDSSANVNLKKTTRERDAGVSGTKTPLAPGEYRMELSSAMVPDVVGIMEKRSAAGNCP